VRIVHTHFAILELGIAPVELVIDIGRQILKAADRKCSEFLSSLVAFRVEIIADREERDCRTSSSMSTSTAASIETHQS
jgi:hypothetical protein